jgi:glycopeptide antibiotics resistance protein
VALAVRERGWRGVGLVAETVVLTATFRAGVELVQLGFPGHSTDATSVVLASLGASVSAVAVATRPRLPARSWIVPALFVWASAVLIDGATPIGAFGPPRGLDARMAFPFYSYFWSPPTAALTNAAEKVTSMVPLGFLLAARSRRWTPVVSALAGWTAGASIEAIQIFNAVRTPDITDTFLAAAGAWLGSSAWRSWDAGCTSPSSSTR